MLGGLDGIPDLKTYRKVINMKSAREKAEILRAIEAARGGAGCVDQ